MQKLLHEHLRVSVEAKNYATVCGYQADEKFQQSAPTRNWVVWNGWNPSTWNISCCFFLSILFRIFIFPFFRENNVNEDFRHSQMETSTYFVIVSTQFRFALEISSFAVCGSLAGLGVKNNFSYWKCVRVFF